MITTYIPVFKDKLTKLERRGLGQSEEARRLREIISQVEMSSLRWVWKETTDIYSLRPNDQSIKRADTVHLEPRRSQT